MYNYQVTYGHFPPAVVLGPDGKTPHSWRVELLPFAEEKPLYDRYRMNEPWDSEHNKQVLDQMPGVFRSPFDDPKSTNSGYYVLVGQGTLFEGRAGIKLSDVPDGTSTTLMIVEAKRTIPWTKPEDIPFDPKKPLPELGGFAVGEFAAAMADGSVRWFNEAKSTDQLARLIMRNDHHPVVFEKMGLEPNRVTAPPRQRSVSTDNATQTRNNLLLIALAMHHYHDLNKHFPAASIVGPDGKTPHSWRVELLPLLQQQAIYSQYRLNEPWDSENNKQVLAQIPDVFHNPYDDAKSTNSGYFAVVGPGTVFEGHVGVKLRDITDGTSNTLMIVEAKRNIPWTKPEDIPFDPDKAVPELGGFVDGRFTAAFADGSVRSLRTDDAIDHLKWLIMRNDGHSILAR